jgi:hypothetical protein
MTMELELEGKEFGELVEEMAENCEVFGKESIRYILSRSG